MTFTLLVEGRICLMYCNMFTEVSAGYARYFKEYIHPLNVYCLFHVRLLAGVMQSCMPETTTTTVISFVLVYICEKRSVL